MSLVVLVLLTGLGNTAHAWANECVAGHCDTHMHLQSAPDHAESAEQLNDAEANDPNGGSDPSKSAECGALQCAALMVLPQAFANVAVRLDAALVWQQARSWTPARLATPTKPPNA